MERNYRPTASRQARESGHRIRVQRLRRERRRKCIAGSLTLAAICCLILVCVISYGSIRAQANAGFKYYTCITVEEGDTFWGIASQYIDRDYYEDVNSYMAELEHINHLDACETLLAGQRLIVPYYSAEYQ